jgi:hypothetical protein
MRFGGSRYGRRKLRSFASGAWLGIRGSGWVLVGGGLGGGRGGWVVLLAAA